MVSKCNGHFLLFLKQPYFYHKSLLRTLSKKSSRYYCKKKIIKMLQDPCNVVIFFLFMYISYCKLVVPDKTPCDPDYIQYDASLTPRLPAFTVVPGYRRVQKCTHFQKFTICIRKVRVCQNNFLVNINSSE